MLTGCVDGVVGPDVSKTEEIKASMAWVSSRNHAMTRCFRCAFGGALHDARANLLRFGHPARSTRRADTRAELSPQRGRPDWGTRGRLSIVVDEGPRRQHGFEADHDRDASSLTVGSSRSAQGHWTRSPPNRSPCPARAVGGSAPAVSGTVSCRCCPGSSRHDRPGVTRTGG